MVPGVILKEKKMTYKEWLRYKRNKNRAKKRKKKKEAGAGVMMCTMLPFWIATAYYIFIMGAQK